MKDYQEDLYRIYGNIKLKTFLRAFIRMPQYRFMFCFRKINEHSKLTFIYKALARGAMHKKGIEIPYYTKIGHGLLMVHPWGININGQSIVGNNVTIYKGATVGNIKVGKHQGTPVIGDNVYIGMNSTVVGGITIGSDVLIAPNAYVNFDVPDHSIVIGSPGVIHYKENATEGYIKNPITLG